MVYTGCLLEKNNVTTKNHIDAENKEDMKL